MLSFGTYRLNYDTAYSMTKNAIRYGISHIDTAQLYMNELAIGLALSNIDNLYITTKIHRADIKASGNDPKAIYKSLMKSLNNIPQTNCILLHSPENNYVEAWRQLCEIYQDYSLDIGVSNFGIEHLTALQEAKLDLPICNQIEITPFNQCIELVKYCNANGIKITSHSCLTKGEKFNDKTLLSIANKHSCPPAQILIKWCSMNDYLPIARTSSEEHLKQNILAKNIKLDISDLHLLSLLDEGFQTHPQFKFVRSFKI